MAADRDRYVGALFRELCADRAPIGDRAIPARAASPCRQGIRLSSGAEAPAPVAAVDLGQAARQDCAARNPAATLQS
jgi:hypothetical protein